VLAVVLAAPLLVAVVQRPQRGVLALAALVPFDGLLLLLPGSGAVAGWKEGLVIVTLAATFVAPTAVRRPAGHRRPGWVPAAGAFALVGLVSAVIVGGDQGMLGAKIGFFYLLLAIASWRCPLDARERDRLVTVLMATGVVTAVYGIVQQLLGAGQLADMGYEYNSTIRFAGGYLRSFSTFVQPFPFGFFLMLVLLVGIPQVLEEPRRLRNQLFLLAVPVLTLGLAASLVRGAWLGLAAGLLYFALTRYRVLFLGAPIIVLGLAFLPTDTTAAALSASSSQERVLGWEQNIARVAANPLGEGTGAVGAPAERVLAEAGVRGGPDDAYQPDSYFVKIGIELGVLGLWLFVVAMAGALRTAHRAARADGRDGALASSTAAYIVAAITASMVATFFEIFPMEAYFWLLLTVTSGMAVSTASTRSAPGTRPARSKRQALVGPA
jgi:hypothetical protein